MDKYKFGEFIYTRRKKLGYTQDELGRKLNVTNKAVSKWETGETLPDVQLLEKLANTLEITIDELLTQKISESKEDNKRKPKKTSFIIQSFITLILLVLCVLLFLKGKEEPPKEEITLQNAEKYYLVTPCEKSVVDGLKLTIYPSIKTKENISDPYILVSFSIQYYYQTNLDTISEILYIDREITYTGTIEDFSISVEPKNPVNNFKSFYGFNVMYEILEVKGSLV